MSTYAQEISRWVGKVQATTQSVVTDAALTVHESIVAGAALTGAPGQPVDTGYLRSSWIVAFDTAPSYPAPPAAVTTSGRTDATPPPPAPPQGSVGKTYSATVTTNVEYAPYIEEGLRATRSSVGGPGSVKLTIGAWSRIVDTAAKRQGGQ
jgi:hypothetical protein